MNLPLPPPVHEDGGTQVGTRARMQEQIPRSTVRNLPALPPREVTGPPNEERTFVDPLLPDFGTQVDETSPSSNRETRRKTPKKTTHFEPAFREAKLPLPPPKSDKKIHTQKAKARKAPKKQKERQKGRNPTVEPATIVVSDPMAPLKGPLIGGRYRLVERVGQGGMGKVYKVTHSHLGKTFALKIISENFADKGKARDLFFREARLASALSHPNIASVVDYGEDEERGAFMVMEFLNGEPLSRIVRRESRLGLRQACDIMLQVAEALDYIHSNKIVHCDIKTENILLCDVPGRKREKQVKLLDFGLARSTVSSRHTASLQGTPHYVAPERIRGGSPTPASDIYGLGILFYELITGKVPWDGTVAQILCGHLDLTPTSPSELLEGGWILQWRILFYALSPNPPEIATRTWPHSYTNCERSWIC